MEKVPHGNIKIRFPERTIRLPGRTYDLVNYDWLFTIEEKVEIRTAFKLNLKVTLEEDKIETFINHLDHLCAIKKELLGQPKKEDIRDKHEKVLKDFKAVLRHLKEIERSEMILWRKNTVSHYGDVETAAPPLPFLMRDAIPLIERYIKVLKDNPKEAVRPGKAPADSDHFVREIRGIFIKDIGMKPTAYKKGIFFVIVQRSLESVGLPYEDPSKTVKAALKAT